MPDPDHLHQPPDVIAAVRGDLADWRAWISRGVILAHAAAAGLAVVAFTGICELAGNAFTALSAGRPWMPVMWTPASCIALCWLTVRFFPGASGSGIPQVMAALNPAVGDPERARFVSLRLSVAKIGLTAGGLLAGLAIGREGPSVQIAAGVMQHARRWLPERSSVSPHGLLVAGGAAGIAAAFNAPLAGITFAIEELTTRLDRRPVLAPAAGIGAWRRRHPVAFAGACGIAIALIGWASGGATFGSGYQYTRELLQGHAALPVLYVTLRLVAT